MKTKSDENQEKRYRLSLDLTEAQFNRLAGLEQKIGSSKSEIVRNALKFYELVANRSLAGETFRSVSKSGKETEVVFVELT